MKVDSSAKVVNLTADQLDGKSEEDFYAADSEIADSDRLDGRDATEIGVNSLQTVEVSSAGNFASSKQVTASCPVGKTLVGTGFDIFGGKSGTDPNVRTDVVMDFVIHDSTSVTVATYEVNDTTANWYVRSFAICAKAP